MNNIIFEIDKDKVETTVQDFFLRSSGLSREGEKFVKMRERAKSIKNEIEERVNIRAVVSYFDKFELEGDTLTIEGRIFKCNPFSLINPKAVKGIYLYVITAGDYSMDDREIMDQLYADIWGTSYVDAGRKILVDYVLEDFSKRNILTGENKLVMVTDSFGPGFYGMETGDTRKIFEIIDGDKIGVECRESGVMVPLKSCTGIYLIVEEGTELPGIECESCLGSIISCNMCNIRG
jgi:hypothetical protein